MWGVRLNIKFWDWWGLPRKARKREATVWNLQSPLKKLKTNDDDYDADDDADDDDDEGKLGQ